MRTLIVVLSLAVATGGCAAMMKDAPDSDWTPAKAPRCSETNGGIALDVIFGAIYGVVALAALSESETALALPFAAVGGLHIWSLVSGYRGTRRCEAALEAHDNWLSNQEDAIERQRRAARRDEPEFEPKFEPGVPARDPDVAPHELADPYADEGPVTPPPDDAEQTTFVDEDGRWKDFWREVKR